MKNIFQFELKQLFRDKKTVFFVFILPLLFMPVISGGLTFFAKSQLESISAERVTVLMQKDSFLQAMEPAFKARKITPVYVDATAINKDSINSYLGRHCAVVQLSRPDSLATPLITVKYVTAKDKQGIHADRVLDLFKSIKSRMINLRYQEIGINDYWQSTKITMQNSASQIQTDRRGYANILPNSLIFVLLFGVFMLANYLILGEKDNKTLETLLSTGVKRSTIIKGKFSLIITGGLIMSVLEFISFYFYGKFASFANYTIHFDLLQIFWFITLSLFMAVFFAALSININCRLKSTSSGSIVMMPLDILMYILIFAGTMEGVSLDRGLLLIPVISFSGILKEVVMGTYSLGAVLTVIGATAFYSGLLFTSAAKVLSREDILERDTEDIDLMTANDKLGFALISFAVIAMVYMQLGGYLQGVNFIWGLAVSLVVIIGGFSVLLLKIGKEPILASYKFKKFDLKYLFLAIFLGFFAKFPVGHIREMFGWVFPMPDMSNSAALIEKAFAGIPFATIVFVAAVLPGIFEELLFRGAFLKLVERGRGAWKTSLIVGALFGAMHLDFFRFLETGLLGVLLTYITIVSGSIFPAMIFHVLNNTTSFILMEYSENKEFASLMENWEKGYHLDYIISGITLVVLAVWLIGGKIKLKKASQ